VGIWGRGVLRRLGKGVLEEEKDIWDEKGIPKEQSISN